jgi:DNA-binding transcriptional LysR family regulator
MSAYASERHVVVKAERALAKADPALSDPGRARRAAVAVPHFALVPAIVAESELIATLPERIAEQFAARYPIAVHRPPVRSPAFTLAMAWPARSDGDPARAWLRDLVREAAAKV